MTGLIARCGLAFGRTIATLAWLAVALGAISLVVSAAWNGAETTLGALAAGWLFSAGLAAGAVAVSAAVRVTGGRWAPTFLPIGEAASGFFGVAFVILTGLLVAARFWIPGTHRAWALAALVGRNLVATGGLFAVGRWYVRRARAQAPSAKALAVAYLVIYAAALSLWVIDLVLGLRKGAPSTVLPPYYFTGAFLGGLAWTALVGCARPTDAAGSRERHDLGKLLFGFVLFWAYLLWAEYLTIWYGNLPDETGELLARWHGPWKWVSLLVVVSVFIFPAVLFLPARTKRVRGTLAFGSGVILIGLLAERCLLVLPSLSTASHVSILSALMVVGVAGLFVLTVGAEMGRRREPHP